MVRIWDATTGAETHVMSHHKGAVTCTAWLPNGEAIVTGGHDRKLVGGGSGGGEERRVRRCAPTWLELFRQAGLSSGLPTWEERQGQSGC